jgi:hypothetical protein
MSSLAGGDAFLVGSPDSATQHAQLRMLQELLSLAAATQQYANRIYAYRGVSKAVPQLSSADPRLKALYHRTFDVLRPCIDLLRDLHAFIDAATARLARLVVDMVQPAHARTTWWYEIDRALGAVIDGLATIDTLKDTKACLSNDFSVFARAFASARSVLTDADAVNAANMDLHRLLAGRDYAMRALGGQLAKIAGWERVVCRVAAAALADVNATADCPSLPLGATHEKFSPLTGESGPGYAHLCAEARAAPIQLPKPYGKALGAPESEFTSPPLLLPGEFFSSVRVVAECLVLLDGHDGAKYPGFCPFKGVSSSSKDPILPLPSKLLDVSACSRALRSFPLVPVFGDITSTAYSALCRARHYKASVPASFGVVDPHSLRTPAGSAPKALTEAYLLVGDIKDLRKLGTRALTVLELANVSAAPPPPRAYLVLRHSLQVLSYLTRRILLQFALKYTYPSPPCKTLTGEDASEYERAVQFNYSAEEKVALASAVQLSKSLYSGLCEASPRLLPLARVAIYNTTQLFAQTSILAFLSSVVKHRRSTVRDRLEHVRDALADWAPGSSAPDSSDASLLQALIPPTPAGAQLPPPRDRDALPMRSQLLLSVGTLVQLADEAAVSHSFLSAGNMLSRHKTVCVRSFAAHARCFSVFQDFSTFADEAASLGHAWFRELFLEIEHRLQFHIECSLPWVVATHLLSNDPDARFTADNIPALLALYDDAGKYALTHLKSAHLFAEIETELNLVFDQLLFHVSELAFNRAMARATVDTLDPVLVTRTEALRSVKPPKARRLLGRGLGTGLGQTTAASGTGGQAVSPDAAAAREPSLRPPFSAVETLVGTRVIHLLGRTVPFSALVAQRADSKLRDFLTCAVSRFEAGGTIAMLQVAFDAARQCHTVLRGPLGLDALPSSFSAYWAVVNGALPLASSPGRIEQSAANRILLLAACGRYVAETTSFCCFAGVQDISHDKVDASAFGSRPVTALVTTAARRTAGTLVVPDLIALIELCGCRSAIVPALAGAIRSAAAQAANSIAAALTASGQSGDGNGDGDGTARAAAQLAELAEVFADGLQEDVPDAIFDAVLPDCDAFVASSAGTEVVIALTQLGNSVSLATLLDAALVPLEAEALLVDDALRLGTPRQHDTTPAPAPGEAAAQPGLRLHGLGEQFDALAAQPLMEPTKSISQSLVVDLAAQLCPLPPPAPSTATAARAALLALRTAAEAVTFVAAAHATTGAADKLHSDLHYSRGDGLFVGLGLLQSSLDLTGALPPREVASPALHLHRYAVTAPAVSPAVASFSTACVRHELVAAKTHALIEDAGLEVSAHLPLELCVPNVDELLADLIL